MTAVAREPDALAAALESFRAHRDEAAFRVLYRLATPRLWALALRIQGDAASAEDAVQEAWMRAVRGMDGFAGRSRFETWLTGILIHVIRERARADRRRHAVERPEASDAPEPRPSGANERRHRTARIDVARALAKLAPGFRTVLVLHDVHAYTHEEIGSMLGIETGTSKSQLSRGRHALRLALESSATPNAAWSNP